jgi:hypothetical protein
MTSGRSFRSEGGASGVPGSLPAGGGMTAEERAAKLLRDYRAEVVGPWFADVIAAAIRAAEADAAAREREACAKVAREIAVRYMSRGSKYLAVVADEVNVAIRARGTAP